MADGHRTRATEALDEHAYTEGYDMDSVYGKKKPSDSSEGGAYVSSVEDSSDGPYGGSKYASPYLKGAAKPTTEDDTESRPPAAFSGYGKHDNSEESRPSGYLEEAGQYSSKPGYGRRHDRGEESETPEGRFGGSDDGRKPNYGGEDEAPEGRFGGSDHRRKPNYGEENVIPEGRFGGSDHGRKPNYGGESETSEGRFGGSEYGRKPNYGGESEAPEGRFGGSDQGRRPNYGGEDETPEGRFGGSDYVRKPNYGGEYETEGQTPQGGGYGGRKPASAYGENEEFRSRPSSSPQSQHGKTPDCDFSGGRISEPRRPGWQQEGEDSGYGGSKGGGRRPSYGRPESEFTEHGTPRPPFGGRQETGEYGSGPKHGNTNEEEEYGVKAPERFGRRDDGDQLFSETAGLSLGSDRHSGGDEGYRPKRDDSDSDDEEKKHRNKHQHHRKHDDDDY